MTSRISPVLIVGAGPVGLSLALALRGIRAGIVDKAIAPSPYCRAIGIAPRTLELFEAMGVAREILPESDQSCTPHGITVLRASATALKDAFDDAPPEAILLRPDGHIGFIGPAEPQAVRRYLETRLGLKPVFQQ